MATSFAHVESEAHPRVGGENWRMRYRIDWIQGSSPRRRGKRYDTACALQARGLIPA